MRAAAEIAPDGGAFLALNVVVDGDVAGAHLDVDAFTGFGGFVFLAQEFELVGLVLHGFAGLVLRDHTPDELLVLVDDLEHHLFEGFEVLGGEGLGHIKVEVETVGDVRADAQLGVGAQLLDCLGHHVGGGVAEYVQPVGGINGDAFDVGAFRKFLVQVLQFAIDAGNNNITALKEEFRTGCPGSHLGLFAIDEKGDLLGI